MKLIYLDEAGNTGSKADPDQPIHMIGSLIVDEARVRAIEIRLNALADRCRTLIQAAGCPVPTDPIEFHGADIYGGRGLFKPISPADRITVCADIIAACRDEEATFGHCAIDKMRLASGHPHMRCFQFTLERLQDHLSRTGDLGLLIADEHRELEEDIIQDLAFSKEFATAWGYRPTPIRNVIDTVHFVKSRHNRLVQACDVLTYFRLKGLRLSTRLRNAHLCILLDKSVDVFDPNTDDDGIMPYSDYVASHTTPAERITLTLNDAFTAFEKFKKLWPL